MRRRLTRAGIEALIDEGLTDSEIARAYVIQPSAVHQFRKYHGIPNPNSESRKEAFIGEYRDGQGHIVKVCPRRWADGASPQRNVRCNELGEVEE